MRLGGVGAGLKIIDGAGVRIVAKPAPTDIFPTSWEHPDLEEMQVAFFLPPLTSRAGGVKTLAKNEYLCLHWDARYFLFPTPHSLIRVLKHFGEIALARYPQDYNGRRHSRR